MVTEAEVHAACDAIDAGGEDPTYKLIRAELDHRGSWSTIRKFRATWIAREADVPPVPEALKEHGLAVIAGVWRTAYPLAELQFSGQRSADLAEAADLAAALQQAEDVIAEKDIELARLTEAATELRARLTAAETTRADEARRHAELTAELAALTKITAQLQAMLSARSEAGAALRVVGSKSVRDERGA